MMDISQIIQVPNVKNVIKIARHALESLIIALLAMNIFSFRTIIPAALIV